VVAIIFPIFVFSLSDSICDPDLDQTPVSSPVSLLVLDILGYNYTILFWYFCQLFLFFLLIILQNLLAAFIIRRLLEQLDRKAKHFKSPGNSKRIEWEFLKITTALYNNRSILMYQNYVYISKEWWYLSNQEQYRIKRLNWKRVKCLTSTSRVWESRWADNTSKLQKTIEYYSRAREYWKMKINNISG